MNKPIKDLDFGKLLGLLDQNDIKFSYERINKEPDALELQKALVDNIDASHFSIKSVLGIDIRSYGTYDDLSQPLIPVLYKILFEEAIELCLNSQEFVFQKSSREEIVGSTISTGDGGFTIFDTPIHSLLFACNFAIVLRLYNSFHLYPKLRKILGEINLRYAITCDQVYRIDDNFFGRAIINNARIIGKDSLNRCLIDENSYEWFLLTIDGVENLQVLSINEIANIKEFHEDYDHKLVKSGNNTFFEEKNDTRNFGIINSDILKIGTIISKNTELNIFNVHIQVSVHMKSDDGADGRIITVSLGNLNTAGI